MMTLNEFQDECTYHLTTRPQDTLEYCLFGLMEEVGEVMEIFKKGTRDGTSKQEVADNSRAQLVVECGDVLWYLAKVLEEAGGIGLEEVALCNIERMKERRRKLQSIMAKGAELRRG